MLNRFDKIIIMDALTNADLKRVSKLFVSNRFTKYGEALHIRVILARIYYKMMTGITYDKKYGARPVQRTLRVYLDDILVELCLSGLIGK